MQLSKFISTMGRNDVRLVSRDQLLIGLIFYPIFFYLILAFGYVPLTNWLLETSQFDLEPFWGISVAYGLVASFPMFFGIVFGMLLVEEQDDRTLAAMMVTPLSLDRFVGYRAVAAATFSFMLLVVTLPIVRIVSFPSASIIPIALVAAISAPMNALLFFSIAENRVQAFAMLKVISSLNVIPLVAYFVPSPWQFIFGLWPPFWAVKATWEAAAGNPYWFYLLPPLALYAMVFYGLIRLFRAKAYSGAV